MEYYFNENDPQHWRKKLAMQREMGICDPHTEAAAREEGKYFALKTTGNTDHVPRVKEVVQVTEIGEIELVEG